MAFDFPANPPVGTIFVSGTTSYTWNGVAWMTHGGDPGAGVGDPADFVLKAGDTMLGFLTANADPVNAMHYATKQYADAVGIPPGGNVGEALAVAPSGLGEWGATIDLGVY